MEIETQNSRHTMTTRAQIVAFGSLCAASIVFWWHSLASTLGLALSNDAYSHILLILPLSAALIYQDSKNGDLKALQIGAQPTPSHRCGSAGSGSADRVLCKMGDGRRAR